jgi:hypothetical protein
MSREKLRAIGSKNNRETVGGRIDRSDPFCCPPWKAKGTVLNGINLSVNQMRICTYGLFWLDRTYELYTCYSVVIAKKP